MTRAVLLRPGQRHPRLGELDARERGVLVRTLCTGVDGTDEGLLGRRDLPAPAGGVLVMGHEAVGVVEGAGDGFAEGDLAVPLVRRGCDRCRGCRGGRADLCSTMGYTEAGIRGRHGFMRDTWKAPPGSLVPAPEGLGRDAVLTEPLSIIVKGWTSIADVQRRIPDWEPSRVLVTGTGSLGALAVLLARLKGASVWALDRHGERTAAARLLRRLGARHVDSRRSVPVEHGPFDAVLETTGAAAVADDAAKALAPNGCIVWLGIPRGGPATHLSMADVVLRNQAVVGSVNSSRVHFEEALRLLAAAKRRWPGVLDAVVTSRYRPEDCKAALTDSGPDVVKKVIDW